MKNAWYNWDVIKNKQNIHEWNTLLVFWNTFDVSEIHIVYFINDIKLLFIFKIKFQNCFKKHSLTYKKQDDIILIWKIESKKLS